MSKTYLVRFIDIDSTFRNRSEYPHSGEFIVKSASTTINNEVTGLTAEDPVLNGYPIHIFAGNIVTTSTTFAGGTSTEPMLQVTPDLIDYRGSLLQDTTLGQSAYIRAYDTATGVAEITNGFSSLFSQTNTYAIQDPSTETDIYFSGGSILDNAYVNFYLKDVTTDEIRPIVKYVGARALITVEPPFTSGTWSITDQYEIRKDPNIFTKGTSPLLGPISMTLDTNLPLSQSYDVVGKYVRIIDPTSTVYNNVRRITAYDPVTRIATVTPSFTGITAPLSVPTTYELLYFSYDNCRFINYMSSCRLDQGLYEVQLQSIILPNQTVLTGYGGRLVSYPYIYIEFGNTSMNVSNLIISNNPSSTRALFKVPVYDTQTRANSNFLKIPYLNVMPQVIIFNPYDDYHFRITMPNGDLFIIQPDTVSPLPPNPELQVSATFMVTRLNQCQQMPQT